MGGAARARRLCNKELSSAQVFFTGWTDQGHAMETELLITILVTWGIDPRSWKWIDAGITRVWSKADINILCELVSVDMENRSFSRMPHFGAEGNDRARNRPPAPSCLRKNTVLHFTSYVFIGREMKFIVLGGLTWSHSTEKTRHKFHATLEKSHLQDPLACRIYHSMRGARGMWRYVSKPSFE